MFAVELPPIKRPPPFDYSEESFLTVVSSFSGHQALDTFNLPLYYKNDEGKYGPRWQVLTDCWPAMPFPSLVYFKTSDVTVLKGYKYLYDEPLLSGQPPLGGHLTALQEWPQINGCSTV